MKYTEKHRLGIGKNTSMTQLAIYYTRGVQMDPGNIVNMMKTIS